MNPITAACAIALVLVVGAVLYETGRVHGALAMLRQLEEERKKRIAGPSVRLK